MAATPKPEGIHNFHQVSEKLYRGAQPTDEGIRNLAKLGIKTVIDLRGAGARSRNEEKVVTAAGMKYLSVPMSGMAPDNEQIARVMAVIEDEASGPVFVHCRRGADRTGTVVACYRVKHDKWNAVKAIKEARDRGMAWVEFGMRRYISAYPSAAPTTATTGSATVATVQ